MPEPEPDLEYHVSGQIRIVCPYNTIVIFTAVICDLVYSGRGPIE